MTVMTNWDLFDEVRSAQDELVRLSRLPGLWSGQTGPQTGAGTASQAWAPAVDITEGTDAYLVAAELPGIGTEDVEVTFQDGLLTIQGERHPLAGAASEKVHRSERRHGAFRRSITLPSHVQADKIEASRAGRRPDDPGAQGAGSARQAHPCPRWQGQARSRRRSRS